MAPYSQTPPTPISCISGIAEISRQDGTKVTGSDVTDHLNGRNIKRFIKNFCGDESGAVTVDWVVLTALIVGLIAAAFGGVEGGVSNLSASLLAFLQGLNPGA